MNKSQIATSVQRGLRLLSTWRSFCVAVALMLYMRKFAQSESAPEAGLRIESGSVLRITPSEQDALWLLAHGVPTRQSGAVLSLAPADFDPFLGAWFASLGTTSRAEALRVASRRGLLMSSSTGASTDAGVTTRDEHR